ncbi:UDP-N-acetylmuramate dehydrogenase [Acidithiobacillus sp. IBUN Pt1247-S3]|uniref:UDP-N-acetylmuramate dehydrogenase n=1 Tax=Acidithiobacillus sp. IBUN Pt1247-S3 TaxID=3166642 RepID=UPI0034E443B1
MIGGRLRLGESLARHSSWRVGGPAENFYLPATADDLAGFLRDFARGPITWLGLGSNVLLRDGGLRGTVICLAHGLEQMELAADGEIIAEAGVSAVKLAHFAAKNGLAGAEFLAGIPGTLGGCLAMNAGAHGGETWPLLEWVELLHPNGERERRAASAFQVGYRSVRGQGDACFVRAGLRLPTGEPEALRAQLRAWQNQRAATQPLSWPSCGSVFRNPSGDHAARLIEAAGLKGRRVGDAEVSTQHANFILNRGQARSREIEALVMEVQETVRKQFNVVLQPEMRVLGEHHDD